MNLYNELNELLVDTFSVILKGEEQTLRKFGRDLSVGEYHLIEAIAKDNAPKTISNIAAVLGISLPSVTIAVKKLENKGYVQKSRSDNDGRSIYIVLTEKGEKINKYHENFHEHMILQIIKQLNEDEKNILSKIISKLNVYFKKTLTTGK